VENKNIIVKESKRFPGLFVRKYKNSVFYDNTWCAETVEARGHVYNAAGVRVVNSPTKIFNHMENGHTIDRDTEVVAIRKVNGFMACATWIPELDRVVVSTTGSLDSDFVGYAEEMFAPTNVMAVVAAAGKRAEYNTTWFFEICHPSDPHIIEEAEGVYLLGGRYVSSGSPYSSTKVLESVFDDVAKEMNVMRPSWAMCRFGDVVKESKTVKHEGFVCYSVDKAIKIKSPYYLGCKAVARKKDIFTLDKKRVDEEFYQIIDALVAMGNEFNAMEEQDRLKLIRKLIEDAQND
jgi:hypothetical protein